MIQLGVNIDHIATLRQARDTIEPDPVRAAIMAELGGADGITVHLREDRRHIQERDVRLLRQTIQTKLNLEMALYEEIVNFALEIKPDIVCIVPEKREEITTEGGLDAVQNQRDLQKTIERLKNGGIRVSVFVDPLPEQISAVKECGAEWIELHTGAYSQSFSSLNPFSQELHALMKAAQYAHSLGLRVNAGHGLDYQNVWPICALPHLEELNIGHSIISRSVFTGLKQAVREMKDLLIKYGGQTHDH